MDPSASSDRAAILKALFWASLVFALFMAVDPKPPELPIDRFGDKFEHVLAFGVLTALAQLAFAATPRWRIAERLSFVGALIEVVQAIPVLHRDCDIRDWIADTAVIVLVTLAFAWRDRARGEPAA